MRNSLIEIKVLFPISLPNRFSIFPIIPFGFFVAYANKEEIRCYCLKMASPDKLKYSWHKK